MIESSIRAYQQKQHAFRAAMDSMRDALRKADPRTEGNETLVLNWGNEESRNVRRIAWDRWNRRAKTFDRAYYAALHHEHAAQAGRFLWCDHCRKLRKTPG